MNPRLFSALAALAVSSTIAGCALAGDSSADAANNGATGATQSAAATTSQSASGTSGSTGAWQPTRGGPDDVSGVNGVQVGNGPGYAWWKDN
jgi:hypothetical protein